MKKLILILLFIPLVSFGQSQEFNGISFDEPPRQFQIEVIDSLSKVKDN